MANSLLEFRTGFQVIAPNLGAADATVCENCHQDMGARRAVVVEGDRVALTCGAPLYNYRDVDWFRQSLDGRMTRLEGDSVKKERRKFSHVAEVDFGQIDLRDKGSYVCRSEPIPTPEDEEYVRESERRFDIEVEKIISPRREKGFSMNNTEVTLITGTKLELSCMVSGRPRPKVIWTKDGVVIPEDVVENRTSLSYEDDGRLLTFEYVLVNDTGVYSCEASNRGGSLVGTLDLTVKPENTLPKGTIAGIVALVVSLLCVGGYLLRTVMLIFYLTQSLSFAFIQSFLRSTQILF